MYRIDKDFGMIWVNKLVNTMAKVEYVPRTRPVTFKNADHFSANGVSRRIENRWIHVALQCPFTTNPTTRI